MDWFRKWGWMAAMTFAAGATIRALFNGDMDGAAHFTILAVVFGNAMRM